MSPDEAGGIDSLGESYQKLLGEQAWELDAPGAEIGAADHEAASSSLPDTVVGFEDSTHPTTSPPKGALLAPSTPAILPGITRRLILQLAEEEGIAVEQRVLTLADLPLVSELFLTGTTAEVLPAVRVNDQPVGDGRPGTVTRRLQRAYSAMVEAFRHF